MSRRYGDGKEVVQNLSLFSYHFLYTYVIIIFSVYWLDYQLLSIPKYGVKKLR